MREAPYAYVRQYYKVPAYVGVRVKASGRDGVLVKPRRTDQYVYILLDGDKRPSGPYHPTYQIDYLIKQQPSDRHGEGRE